MKELKVDIENIEEGMLAAEDVRTAKGTLIIRRGAELEGKHMNLLKAAGILQINAIVPSVNTPTVDNLNIDHFPKHKDILKSARILIVDDSKLMRLKLRKIVEEAGLNLVGQAENGVEAVDMAKELQPTFITMDIEMPEMNGLDAVKAIHGMMPDVRIIMISSLGQEDLIIESISSGAIDFIHKPFDPVKVKKSIISNIIDEYHSL